MRAEKLEDRRMLAAFTEFVDPNPNPGNNFGASVVPLETGNVVITAPRDDAGGTDAGAVYLFNGVTGDLISTLVGSSANDRIGDSGVVVLEGGNYVVRSSSWDNGAATDAGAVTFGSGVSGVSGVVSAANSLVGSSPRDFVGSFGVVTLEGGNYVVRSPSWDNGAATDAGAVTFGSGVSGVSGVIDSANSLVGSSESDEVGLGGVAALEGGNYVVLSPSWDNGAASDAGAATFGNGVTGVSGVIDSANSLVGSSVNDRIGDFNSVSVLEGGNYVVSSPDWDNGAVIDAGAATFGSGVSGVSGVISAANSLVGSSVNDRIGGFNSVSVLEGGNYVVSSPDWDNGAASNVGAVTFGSGVSGVSGVIDSANSLVGSSANDQVGSFGVVALEGGNYVVFSPFWDNGEVTNVGAVTFGSGVSGVSGVVSAANSLVGSSASDRVGSFSSGRGRLSGVVPLDGGNYVVLSPFWDNGAVTDVGAVTFGSGVSGVSGVISAANSLVGSSANDRIGNLNSVSVLDGGNYVVSSPFWDNGAVADVGAVTFGSGVSGISGVVSAANSLVGSSANDRVGRFGVIALEGGGYVVRSPDWDNGAAADAGAATFGSGVNGVSGLVSAANSLVGSSANDRIGDFDRVSVLEGGNYVVSSPDWDNGAAFNVGAVTFGSGVSGVSGLVSAANSLVGSSANDRVGRFGVIALEGGGYLVSSPDWDNGAATDAGAVTFGDGVSGVSGLVSAANSLVGSSANDRVGRVSAIALEGGGYVVLSTDWDNGEVTNAGAVTFGSGVSGVSGVVSAANSLVGSSANDQVGSFGVVALEGGNYVVLSPFWDNETATGAGAVTFGNAANGGAVGEVGFPSSVVGLTSSTGLQDVVVDEVNGNFYARFLFEEGGRVRVGSQTSGFLDATPPLPGDYNGDNVVDAADYTVWRDSFNQTVAFFAGADGNGNGVIDQDDRDIWRANFGSSLETTARSNATIHDSDFSTLSSNNTFASEEDLPGGQALLTSGGTSVAARLLRFYEATAAPTPTTPSAANADEDDLLLLALASAVSPAEEQLAVDLLDEVEEEADQKTTLAAAFEEFE